MSRVERSVGHRGGCFMEDETGLYRVCIMDAVMACSDVSLLDFILKLLTAG